MWLAGDGTTSRDWQGAVGQTCSDGPPVAGSSKAGAWRWWWAVASQRLLRARLGWAGGGRHHEPRLARSGWPDLLGWSTCGGGNEGWRAAVVVGRGIAALTACAPRMWLAGDGATSRDWQGAVGPTCSDGPPVAGSTKAGAWRWWRAGHRSAYCVSASDVAGGGRHLLARSGSDVVGPTCAGGALAAGSSKAGAWRWWLVESAALTACAPRIWGWVRGP